MSLFGELKRRNVFRVGIAYAVAAWIVLQLTDVLSELLDLPGVVGRAVVVIVAVGFLLALFLAWAYELTPEGVKRESEVAADTSITRQTGRRLNGLITGLLLIAVAYLLFDKFWLQERIGAEEKQTVAGARVEENAGMDSASVAGADQRQDENPEGEAPVSRRSVAVLPFENRSRLEDDAFFVEGIHDDLLTTLARIGSLKVISRTSVSKYANTDKTIPEIADELGVATVLEGAVQRAGDTVRINVQLIDARTDEHLWAEIFDRELTAENLFAIQSEISERIAGALETALTPEEERRIRERPTDNLAAYNAYLRARQLQARRTTAQLEQAMEEYRRAVELDPDFAQAWVGIAETATLLTVWGTLSREERNRIRTEAAERAIALAPELGEAWLVNVDTADSWDEAEARYRKAIELSPNYATAYQWYANDIQDDFRRLAEAQELLEKAVSLDPLSPILRDQVAWNLNLMGRYDAAEQRLRTLLAEDPEFVPALQHLAHVRLMQGDMIEAVRHYREALRLDPGNPGNYASLILSYQLLDYTDGLDALRESLAALSPDLPLVGMIDGILALMQGRPAAALEHLRAVEQKTGPARQLKWQQAYLHMELGDFDAARASIEVAEPRLFDSERWTEMPGGDRRSVIDLCAGGYLMQQTGEVEAGQARMDAGLEFALNELPRYVDDVSDELLACYRFRGEHERLMAVLERMLERGNLLWVEFMKLDALRPAVDDLDSRAEFIELLQRGEAEIARQREELRRIDAAEESA